MKPQHLALFVGLSLSAFTNNTLASQTDNAKAAFSTAYQSYLNAVETKHDIEQAAKRAYTTGLTFYGDKSDNTANLAINYAKAITPPSTTGNKKT
ncbi:hypothetical protein ATS73_011665 [Pseudoalteromonas sp. H100]|nr:hypothetical protein [Pseudoalteromonas sp. H100]WFO18739.1 hypothetical protein ATS73_011665 [Pseudoalteromonas sp. H100]